MTKTEKVTYRRDHDSSEVAATTTIRVDGKAFHTALRHALPCTLTEHEYRPTLSAVLLERTATGLRLVATDTFRLLVQDLACDWQGEERGVLVPAAFVKFLLSGTATPQGEWTVVLGEVDTKEGTRRGLGVFGEAGPRSRMKAFGFVAPQVEGQYINYDKVIPRSSETEVLLSPAEAVVALKQVMPAAKRDAGRTELWCEGNNLYLRAEAKGEIAAETWGLLAEYCPVPSVHLGANVSYLLDYLKWQEGEVSLRLNGPLNSLLFANGRSTYVVMPMMLDQKGR